MSGHRLHSRPFIKEDNSLNNNSFLKILNLKVLSLYPCMPLFFLIIVIFSIIVIISVGFCAFPNFIAPLMEIATGLCRSVIAPFESMYKGCTVTNISFGPVMVFLNIPFCGSLSTFV